MREKEGGIQLLYLDKLEYDALFFCSIERSFSDFMLSFTVYSGRVKHPKSPNQGSPIETKLCEED